MGVPLLDIDHEQIAVCHDRATGLRVVIAIHNTALGPALGGTRFVPYACEDDALADALRLARAMSYKNALAGLAHGGGKAVIIGDPARDKTPDLLRAYGRFVESLGGRYVTACDVGTYVADMDVVAETTRWATGRSPERGGAGDSGELTAYGVFAGMRAGAHHTFEDEGLAGRTVGIAGVGKVGARLAASVLEAGGQVVAADVDPRALDRLVAAYPQVKTVPTVADLVRSDLDIYAPCALGGALDEATVETLTARLICGGANNQLAVEGPGGTAERLHERGITYCPDYLVNAGGVIQVSDELAGFDLDRARARTAGIYDQTLLVLRRAQADGVSPAVAADLLAEERMASGSAHPWLPGGPTATA